MQKEDPMVRRGFIAYERYYVKNMGRRTALTYDHFRQSRLYTDLVKFGRYTIDNNVINLIGYIDFLIRLEIPTNKWTNTTIYSTYVTELNKTEPPLDAMERSFKVMQQWSIETGEDWQNFFRKVEVPRATLWIVNGKLSPWILFTASSVVDLFSRLPPEQASMIDKAIDTSFWKLKLERNKVDADIIRTTLAEYGI